MAARRARSPAAPSRSGRSSARTSCGCGRPAAPHRRRPPGSTPRSRSSEAKWPATAVLPVRLPVPITVDHGAVEGERAPRGGGVSRKPAARYSRPRSSATEASRSARRAVEHRIAGEVDDRLGAARRRQLAQRLRPAPAARSSPHARSGAAGSASTRSATFSSPPDEQHRAAARAPTRQALERVAHDRRMVLSVDERDDFRRLAAAYRRPAAGTTSAFS